MKAILAIVVMANLIGMSLIGCTKGSGTSAAPAGAPGLTLDQKHRLYTAALVASESPFESEILKKVCQAIGIFDAHGEQNENYLEFVQAHIEWAMKSEIGAFKREIDSREKAREYIRKHLP